jgi:hypothetical protein
MKASVFLCVTSYNVMDYVVTIFRIKENEPLRLTIEIDRL